MIVVVAVLGAALAVLLITVLLAGTILKHVIVGLFTIPSRRRKRKAMAEAWAQAKRDSVPDPSKWTLKTPWPPPVHENSTRRLK